MSPDFVAGVAAWHAVAFPGATTDAIALKLAEEAGEVVGEVYRCEHEGGSTVNLRNELGDLLICVAALAARYRIHDLDVAARERLQEVAGRPRRWTR